MSAAPSPSIPGRSRLFLQAARICVVVTAAWIAFASAVLSAFMLLALVCWLCSGRWGPAFRAAAAEPAAWMGLALYVALAAAVAWSRAPLAEALATLGKYRELAFFALVMFLFAEPPWRRRLLEALFASGVALLAASWLVYFGWERGLDPERLAKEGAVVMKNSIIPDQAPVACIGSTNRL